MNRYTLLESFTTDIYTYYIYVWNLLLYSYTLDSNQCVSLGKEMDKEVGYLWTVNEVRITESPV